MAGDTVYKLGMGVKGILVAGFTVYKLGMG